MKIQMQVPPSIKTKYKLLKAQLRFKKDLESKNKQLREFRKFIDDLNTKLEKVSATRVSFTRKTEPFYLVVIAESEWVYIPGMSTQIINQIKLEILEKLGY